jgi:hypothetical protein
VYRSIGSQVSAIRYQLSGDAEDVVRAVISAAKDGDMVAAKIVLDRIAPPTSHGRSKTEARSPR